MAEAQIEVEAPARELEERACALASRPLEGEERREVLALAVRAIDLTTLEGADTPERVKKLAARALRPVGADDAVPPVAALCVYPNLVPAAADALRGTAVRVASVAGGFPAAQTPLEVKLAEVRWVVEHGAEEVDVPIDRGAFLAGDHEKVYDELVRIREAAAGVTLKVILETGELGSYADVTVATRLAIAAGADFVKTSTGKIATGATLPAALCILEAIRDHRQQTNGAVGFKAAGGVRQARQAIEYVTLVERTLGRESLTPEHFRIGASSLLDDVAAELRGEHADQGIPSSGAR